MTLYNWIFVSPAHSLAARQMPLRYSVNLVPKVFLRDCYSVGEKLSQQMRSSTAAVIASLPKQPNEEVLHCTWAAYQPNFSISFARNTTFNHDN